MGGIITPQNIFHSSQHVGAGSPGLRGDRKNTVARGNPRTAGHCVTVRYIRHIFVGAHVFCGFPGAGPRETGVIEVTGSPCLSINCVDTERIRLERIASVLRV